MYFVTGKDLANFLFKGWNTNGHVSGLLGMCAAVLFATILLEAIRTLMAFLSLRNSRIVSKLHTQNKLETCKTKYAMAEDDVDDPKVKQRLATHAALSVLQFVSTGLAYILMLAVMTYNVWIGVSVLIGTLIGYFFFGALRDHMTYSQQTAPSAWPADKPHKDDRSEILSRSNGAYSNSSSDVHMDLTEDNPTCVCTCYCHLSP